MGMFLAGHALCCSLAEHDLDAPVQMLFLSHALTSLHCFLSCPSLPR